KYIIIAAGHQNIIATLALKTIRIHIRYGVITTLLGFVLALMGLPLLKPKDWKEVNKAQPAAPLPNKMVGVAPDPDRGHPN
ncbi:MAG: hypothetical protein NTW14_07105, partial [bacterium]|nr:hypothetical protein [bacterium]